MMWEFILIGFALGILTMTIINLYRWACSSDGLHWAWKHGWKEPEKKDEYRPLEELMRK